MLIDFTLGNGCEFHAKCAFTPGEKCEKCFLKFMYWYVNNIIIIRGKL